MIQSQHNQTYSNNLRYFLTKKKLDVPSLQHIEPFCQMAKNQQRTSLKTFNQSTNWQIKSFIVLCESKNRQKNPLFTHHRVPHQKQLKQQTDTQHDKKKKQLNQSIILQSLNKSSYFSKTIKTQISPFENQKIPQFYFPQGKVTDLNAENATKNLINTIFGKNNEIQASLCKKLVVEVIGLPNYFSTCILSRCLNPNKITKLQFNKIWKQLESFNQHKRAFNLLSSDKNKKFISIDDFKKFFKEILKVHQGLKFLQQTPEFQDWYSICVINRIFFVANKKNDYQMSYREFKKSKILKSLFDIQAEPEINENKDFFSYQDFYVIYIKFWQLDSDHDFLLSKQELSKYSGYTLSRKTIQRVYSQIARKFQHPQKMTFGDFSWFIYCVQDKTTQQSIQYWFKIIDLDNNGIIAGYQLQFFFQQQSQRLAYMDGNSTQFNFDNIICQMMDLLKPMQSAQFRLEDFLKTKSDCGLFINFLTDLNKLVAFDQRDAYDQRNQKNEHPDWTQWDKFVKPQYKRVQNAGQNQEAQQMSNWEDDA